MPQGYLLYIVFSSSIFCPFIEHVYSDHLYVPGVWSLNALVFISCVQNLYISLELNDVFLRAFFCFVRPTSTNGPFPGPVCHMQRWLQRITSLPSICPFVNMSFLCVTTPLPASDTWVCSLEQSWPFERGNFKESVFVRICFYNLKQCLQQFMWHLY